MEEPTLSNVCELLEELLASGRALSMRDAICETGAAPKLLDTAFEHLLARGRATRIGGVHRGWSIVGKARR